MRIGQLTYDSWTPRLKRGAGEMETWDAITSRRNVREFEDRPISAEDLDQILEAGRRAPSSRNWQPWDFIVVTDRAQLEELSGVWRGGGHIAHSAATVAVVLPEFDDADRSQRAAFDVGQASVQMMIAAADLGIGSGHSAVGDQAAARRILGLPEDRAVYIMIDLGYPADRPLRPIRRPDRRPFEEVVHRGRW
jgi:nitroreductase